MLIDLALTVLAEQHAKAKPEKRQVAEVRLALHVLRPYAPRDWLIWYWEACGYDDPIMRQQEITRTLNGIRLRLKRDP